MKKILTVLMAVLLLLACTACGKKIKAKIGNR